MPRSDNRAGAPRSAGKRDRAQTGTDHAIYCSSKSEATLDGKPTLSGHGGARLRAERTSDHLTHNQARAIMLAALDDLDTPTLWQMVRRGAETEAVLVLAALNEKRQHQGLTAAEEAVVQELIRQHDQAVLIRAKALALLRRRGEDVRDVIAEA